MSKGEEVIEAYLRDNVEIDIACAVAILDKWAANGTKIVSSLHGEGTISKIDWEEEYRVEYERKVRGGGEAEEK